MPCNRAHTGGLLEEKREGSEKKTEKGQRPIPGDKSGRREKRDGEGWGREVGKEKSERGRETGGREEGGKRKERGENDVLSSTIVYYQILVGTPRVMAIGVLGFPNKQLSCGWSNNCTLGFLFDKLWEDHYSCV